MKKRLLMWGGVLVVALSIILAVSARSSGNCKVFGQSIYVETGTLSQCVKQKGLAEYTNVRRLDGSYSEHPGELKILLWHYMEFKEIYDNEPGKLTEKDYERFAELQEQILRYDKNDISFMYGFLIQ